MLVVAAALASSPVGARAGTSEAPPGVGPQYDSTHVYVAPQDFDKFVASLTATFGGSASQRALTQVTPTPSKTLSQIVLTPVGIFSVFGFTTPIPWPFGSERTGYLVADIDAAVRAAQANVQSGAQLRLVFWRSEFCDYLALSDAVTFIDGDLGEAARIFRGNVKLGRFNASVRLDDAVRQRLAPEAGDQIPDGPLCMR